eukprot:TRINITY_DN4357_c0_g1_i1.p2 TRINITY_DN4357_c0_g1~~TRINITY_DN4357_c0_g1_i1.p2  ORF type:complete len:452 (-),score=65.83 TRINITY_DN4357_c0_g1_i1:1528-2883(-)
MGLSNFVLFICLYYAKHAAALNTFNANISSSRDIEFLGPIRIGSITHGDSEKRQLDVIAFPIGLFIGSIAGSAIFPPPTSPSTTTTTTTRRPGSSGTNSGSSNANNFNNNFIQVITTTRRTTTTTRRTTTTTRRTTTRPTLPQPPVNTNAFRSFPNCGEKGASTRIIGGEEIQENEYPWLCSLRFAGSHICGVTLLSGPPQDTILVGAAHCYDKNSGPRQYSIVCGEHNLRRADRYEVTMRVIEVVVHPKYRSASRTGYDIAIYKVDTAPLLGKLIRKKLYPICLPDVDDSYDDKSVIVSGWGVTQTRRIRGTPILVRSIPNVARHVKVNVLPCTDQDGFRFPDGLLCAADDGRDSCQGDSGGPLMVQQRNNKYSWIGIVSFGVGCAKPGYPGAYTRTTCFLHWIANEFGLPGISTTPSRSKFWSTMCPDDGGATFNGFLSDEDVIIVEDE